jgi:hypothetical protein
MVELPINWILDEPTMTPSQILTHSFSFEEAPDYEIIDFGRKV